MSPLVMTIPQPQRPRLRSTSSGSMASSSTSNVTLSERSLMSTTEQQQQSNNKRSYLYIFVILWFSSLQIVLFTWNQIPPMTVPHGLLVGGNVAPDRRRRLTTQSTATGTQCSRFQSTSSSQPEYYQACGILHQMWQTIPEPVDRSTTAERRVYPNALVRRNHNNNNINEAEQEQDGATTAIKSTDTVVLATHLGVAKLDVLLTQARWWAGPVSAALLIQDEDSVDIALNFMQTHAAELQQVSFHFVLEKTNLPYPHNILRNLALEYLGADYFVAADVDFIPSWGAHAGLHALLHAPASKVRAALLSHRLLVLPAFERLQNPGQDTLTEDMLPRTKADVQVMFKDKSLIGFHMAGSPLGHGPTNFPKWLKSKFTLDDYYEIEYKNVFEPYVMGYRPGLPRYWEDFRGYGYNKFSWYIELHRACYEFGVLRDYFVVHMNHPLVERDVKHDQTLTNRDSWKHFKSYLSGRYKQTCHELPKAVAAVSAKKEGIVQME